MPLSSTSFSSNNLRVTANGDGTVTARVFIEDANGNDYLSSLWSNGNAIGRSIAAASQQALASAQTASTGVAATARNITTGLSTYRTAMIVLTLTSTGTGTGSMTLILQGSADSGATWVDLAAFPASTPSIPNPNSKPAIITLNEYGTQTAAPAFAAAAPGSMAAATAYVGPWGDRLRVFENVTAAYTAAPVYNINGLFKS